MRVSTILLYTGALACAYALYVQASYSAGYLGDPFNPYRHEYLGGIIIIGSLSAAAWIPTLLFAFMRARVHRSRPWPWLLPLAVSTLVPLFSVAAAIVSVAA